MRNHAYFFRENFILEEIYFNSFFFRISPSKANAESVILSTDFDKSKL